MGTLQVKFDNLTLELGEANVSVSKQPLLTKANLVWATRHTWTIQGQIVSTDTVSVNARAKTIMDAFGSQFGTGVSVVDANGQDTNLKLMAADTVSGNVRVMRPPEFPNVTGGGALNTYLDFRAVVQAEVPVDSSNLGEGFSDFFEELSFVTQRTFAFIDNRFRIPTAQQIRAFPLQRIRQRGYAVGIYGEPVIPFAMFPEFLIGTGQIVRTTPKRWGRGNSPQYTHYRTSWAYDFETPYDLIQGSFPNLWV